MKQILDEIRVLFVNMFTNNSVEETLNVPENPFSQERLAGLPGGMTRMGAAIIKGKLDGHAASSANRLSPSTVGLFFFGTVARLRLSFSRELGRRKALLCFDDLDLLHIDWLRHSRVELVPVNTCKWQLY